MTTKYILTLLAIVCALWRTTAGTPLTSTLALRDNNILLVQEYGQSVKKVSIDDWSVRWNYTFDAPQDLLCADTTPDGEYVLFADRLPAERDLMAAREEAAFTVVSLRDGAVLAQRRLPYVQAVHSPEARDVRVNGHAQCGASLLVIGIASPAAGAFVHVHELSPLTLGTVKTTRVENALFIAQAVLRSNSSTNELDVLFAPTGTPQARLCMAQLTLSGAASAIRQYKSCYDFETGTVRDLARVAHYYTARGAFIAVRDQFVYFFSRVDQFVQKHAVTLFDAYNQYDVSEEKSAFRLITFPARNYFLSQSPDGKVYKLFFINESTADVSLIHEVFHNRREGTFFFERSDDELLYFRLGERGRAKSFYYNVTERYERRAAFVSLTTPDSFVDVHVLPNNVLCRNESDACSKDRQFKHDITFVVSTDRTQYAILYTPHHTRTEVVWNDFDYSKLKPSEVPAPDLVVPAPGSAVSGKDTKSDAIDKLSDVIDNQSDVIDNQREATDNNNDAGNTKGDNIKIKTDSSETNTHTPDTKRDTPTNPEQQPQQTQDESQKRQDL